MDDLDIRLLRSFVVLVAEGNVTRAAHRLGIGQPSMSQNLARLRAHFGDPLLVRTQGGMIPTDRARELEQSARRILAEYERMVAGAEVFDPATSTRRFVLTIPEYAEHILLPRMLENLRRRSPGIGIEVRAPKPERALEMLEAGEVDLRVAWLLTPAQSLRSMPLFQDRIVCLASQRHPRIQGELTSAEFLASPHVRPLGTGRPTTAVVLEKALARTQGKIERLFLVQNFLTIPSIVARTDMLATLPMMLAATFAKSHSLQILELPMRVPRIRYAAYWHERSHKDEGHQWLRKLVKDAVNTLAQPKEP